MHDDWNLFKDNGGLVSGIVSALLILCVLQTETMGADESILTSDVDGMTVTNPIYDSQQAFEDNFM